MANMQAPKCVTYQALPSGLSHTTTPGIFQIVTPIIEATRATFLGAFGSLKLIGTRFPLGLNQRQLKIHSPSSLCINAQCALSLCRRSGPCKTWGNQPKPAKLL